METHNVLRRQTASSISEAFGFLLNSKRGEDSLLGSAEVARKVIGGFPRLYHVSSATRI